LTYAESRRARRRGHPGDIAIVEGSGFGVSGTGVSIPVRVGRYSLCGGGGNEQHHSEDRCELHRDAAREIVAELSSSGEEREKALVGGVFFRSGK